MHIKNNKAEEADTDTSLPCREYSKDNERIRSGAVLIIALTVLLLIATGILFCRLFTEKNGFITETLEDGSEQSYYYLHGEKVTGWHVVGSYKRYFDENGIMVKGWREIDGKKYYFRPENGSLAVSTTLTLEDGNKYVFDDDGACITEKRSGWYTAPDGSTVFYNQNGSKVTGWREIDGRKYYFQPRTGRMLVSETAYIDGVTYIFDENGSAVPAN